MVCSADCKCGTPKNPCKNRVGSVTSVYVLSSPFVFYLMPVCALQQENVSEEGASRDRSPHGKRAKLPCRFRGLAQQENAAEDQKRKKENSDVKVSLQIDTDYMIY